jgi:hypothetical protein
MVTTPLPTLAMPQTSQLRLAEVAHVIADTFCMVPIQGRRGNWRSGHYELRLDRGAKLLQLRVRSHDRHAFRLTLALASVGGLRAMVSGTISPRGYQDLMAADERLGGAIFQASCPPRQGTPPAAPLQLLDVLKVDCTRAFTAVRALPGSG